jgi:PIN domain nuclease of toxin-antitoxin system
MRLLLDTHALLWFVVGDRRMTNVARSAIEDEGNEVIVSVATVWETTLKHSVGKLHLAEPIDLFLHRELKAFSVLPILASHALRTAGLPFHHRDPFDRLLAAVCLEESLLLVSTDNVFDAYGIDRLWDAVP